MSKDNTDLFNIADAVNVAMFTVYDKTIIL